MDPELWTLITALAAQQDGLVSATQVHEAGCRHRTLRRAIEHRLLVPVRQGVYSIAGTPPSTWQPLRAACLAAGPHVVASHRSAGELHVRPGFLPGAVEVTSLFGRPLRLTGVSAHATSALGPEDVVGIGGIPTTSVVRTVVDVAAETSPSLLATVVDFVVARRLCAPADVECRLAQLGGRGRSGTAQLRRVLEDRIGGDSGLEARWLRVLRRADLPPPVLQHQVVVGHRVLVLDLAWPEVGVGMEVDGWQAHGSRSAWDHDHDKINAYLEQGWRVLFVTSNTPEAATVRQLRSLIGTGAPCRED